MQKLKSIYREYEAVLKPLAIFLAIILILWIAGKLQDPYIR